MVSAGVRGGAVSFFMTDVYGAPRAFVFAMPFLMPNAWKRNKLVVHTLPYDLTILDDRSVLNERSPSISVPTLVIGGEKSPKVLRDVVTVVANALLNGKSRFLSGQDHNISAALWPRSCLSTSVRAGRYFCPADRFSLTGPYRNRVGRGQTRKHTETISARGKSCGE